MLTNNTDIQDRLINGQVWETALLILLKIPFKGYTLSFLIPNLKAIIVRHFSWPHYWIGIEKRKLKFLSKKVRHFNQPLELNFF